MDSSQCSEGPGSVILATGGSRFLPLQKGQKGKIQEGQRELQEWQENVTQSEVKSLEISIMDSSVLPQNDKAGQKGKIQEG